MHGTGSIDASKIQKEAALIENINKPYTVIRHLSQERKAYFPFFGFIKLANPEIVDVMNTEIAKAQWDGVVHTTFEVEYVLIDTIVPYAIGAVGCAVFGPVGLNFTVAFNTQTYRINGMSFDTCNEIYESYS